MTVVGRIIEARKEIPVIKADETARITGNKGSFSFKYASLPGLLETVVPILNKHGLLLSQEVSSSDNRVVLETKLLADEGEVTSGKLHMPFDGTTRDLASKVTSLKRIQLVALLGLSVSDDDDEAVDRPPVQRQPQRPSQPAQQSREAPTWEANEVYRKAVMRSNANVERSTGLSTLLMKVRHADTQSDKLMPTTPAPGKKNSMYHYLLDLVSKAGAKDPCEVLSYLYGRVISTETPPSMSSKFLIDELMEGRHAEAITEVNGLVQQ